MFPRLETAREPGKTAGIVLTIEPMREKDRKKYGKSSFSG
jgi:hypothetical protein